jgi:sulfite exporter TauE/SafE
MIERLVGLTLIGVGLASIWRAHDGEQHWHEHDGVRHAHAESVSGPKHERDHHALLGIGMLHGVAGTGALVIAIPLSTNASPAQSMVFLASFGLGTILAMSLFAGAAGALLGRVAQTSEGTARWLRIAAGAASVVVGVWWIVAAGS